MTRLHSDPVDVRTVDGEPAQFLWHGRLHVVREVLARWTSSGGWWQGDAVRALATGESSGATAGGTAGGTGIDDREQAWWRVEAAAGMSSPGGVYDLCFAWSGGPGGWTLARVLD